MRTWVPIFPENCASRARFSGPVAGNRREETGSREPIGFSDYGLPHWRRLTRRRTRTRSRKGHRARGARPQPTRVTSRRRTAAKRVQGRTDRRGRPAHVRGPHRHRRARRRAWAGNTCSSSRSSCRSPDRHARGRIRLEPSAHGAGTAGRHADPLGTRGIVRRDGWAAVRRRASRRTASTRTCPSSASRFRRPSMTAYAMRGRLPGQAISTSSAGAKTAPAGPTRQRCRWCAPPARSLRVRAIHAAAPIAELEARARYSGSGESPSR